MRLKPGLRVPGLVVSAVSVMLCDPGDCPLASQTLLAVALWDPGRSTLFCCWW